MRWLSVFCCTIGPSASSRARSDVTVAQITPDVCCRKKAIACGVANSAAMIRSPSFSRSSSSTTTTISPRPIAATASSMLASAVTVTVFQVRSRSTYLAVTSTSRLTRAPGPLRARFVTAVVCGMTATVKPSSSTSTIVRLIPSTVIEPFSTT